MVEFWNASIILRIRHEAVSSMTHSDSRPNRDISDYLDLAVQKIDDLGQAEQALREHDRQLDSLMASRLSHRWPTYVIDDDPALIPRQVRQEFPPPTHGVEVAPGVSAASNRSPKLSFRRLCLQEIGCGQ
jgi:hypothetical protein